MCSTTLSCLVDCTKKLDSFGPKTNKLVQIWNDQAFWYICQWLWLMKLGHGKKHVETKNPEPETFFLFSVAFTSGGLRPRARSWAPLRIPPAQWPDVYWSLPTPSCSSGRRGRRRSSRPRRWWPCGTCKSRSKKFFKISEILFFSYAGAIQIILDTFLTSLTSLGQKFRVWDCLLIGPVQKPVDGQNDGHVLSRKSNGIQNHDHRDKSWKANWNWFVKKNDL